MLTLFYVRVLYIFVIAVLKILLLIPISESSLVIFLWTVFSLDCGSYFPASLHLITFYSTLGLSNDELQRFYILLSSSEEY